MTSVEAIKTLKTLRGTINGAYDYNCRIQCAALDIAIKALEQAPCMTEKWEELKETIIELRDNDGTSTQQETCKFLANLMDVLERQMSSTENPNIKKKARDKI